MGRAANNNFNYLVGKVFPADHCYENFKGKKRISDNIPTAELRKLNLRGVPLTIDHPPLNKVIADAPEIRRGTVTRSFIDKSGDLWGVSRLDTDTLNGGLLLDDIKRGRQMGLSLGHKYKIDENSREEYIPDHLALVKKPRRPECYVYQFGAASELPAHFTEDNVQAMTDQINALPHATTISVHASADGQDSFEVRDYTTCSLGTLDPSTFHFSPHTTGSTNELRVLFQGKTGHLASYFNNPYNNILVPYSRSIRNMMSNGTQPLEVIETASEVMSAQVPTIPVVQDITNANPTTQVTPNEQQADPKQDQQPPPTEKKAEANGIPAAESSEKKAAKDSPDVEPVKSDEIKDELMAMADGEKINVVVKLMNDAKEKQVRIQKTDADNVKLREEVASLKKQVEATHKEENDKLNNKLSNYLSVWGETAKKKVAGTTREPTIAEHANDVNGFSDLPISHKRKLAQAFELIEVASEGAGGLQSSENDEKRRRFSMSENSGNSSLYARLNDTLGVPNSQSQVQQARPPPTNLSGYLHSLGNASGPMNTVSDDNTMTMMAEHNAESRFLSKHHMQQPSYEPKILSPY